MNIWVGGSKISHYSAKFGSHKHCANGDMVLVVEEQDSISFRLSHPLLFISKEHDFQVNSMSNALRAVIEEKYTNNPC